MKKKVKLSTLLDALFQLERRIQAIDDKCTELLERRSLICDKVDALKKQIEQAEIKMNIKL